MTGGSGILAIVIMANMAISDLYNIIWDNRFDIGENLNSADYQFEKAPELDHPITLKDVGEFFVDFMQNNILGLIANRHLIISDQSPMGIHDERCLKLAEMASVAVDFPKTGIKVGLPIQECDSNVLILFRLR